MDINENQQTHTFYKGMNTDTSDAYISSEQYRYAENLRFVNDSGSKNGELSSIKDWRSLFKDSSGKNLYDGDIIATCTIRDYGVFITKAEDGKWRVYRFKDGESEVHPVFGPCDEKIGDSPCILGNYETEDIIKVYIADGVNPLMVINVSPNKTGNTETKIERLTGQFDNGLPEPLSVGSSTKSGSIKAHSVQYAYVFYNNHEQQSTLSAFSKIYHIFKNKNTGYRSNKITSKAVDIVLMNYYKYKPLFSKIKIYRIGYLENGLLPLIDLIIDQELSTVSDRAATFTDTGYNIASLSLAEFVALDRLMMTPKIIEEKDNYLFAANINYNQDEIDKLLTIDVNDAFDITQEYEEQILDIYNNRYASDMTTLMSGDLIRSLRTGEQYQYGVIFYDKRGNRTSVRKFNTITITRDDNHRTKFKYINGRREVVDISVIQDFLTTNKDDYRFITYPIHLKFSLKDTAIQLLRENFSHYEIVRADRNIENSTILSQGVVGFTQGANNNRYPHMYISLGKKEDRRWGNKEESVTKKDLLVYASPEYSYFPDSVKDEVSTYKEQLYLSPVADYTVPRHDAPVYGGGDYYVKNGNAGWLDMSYRLFLAEGSEGYYCVKTFIPGVSDTTAPPIIHITNMAYNALFPSNAINRKRIFPSPGYYTQLVINGHDTAIDDPESKTDYKVYYLDSSDETARQITQRGYYNGVIFPVTDYNSILSSNIAIDDVEYTNSTKTNISDDGNMSYSNDKLFVDNVNYINWYSNVFDENLDIISDKAIDGHYITNTWKNLPDEGRARRNGKKIHYYIGSGGSYMLLKPTTDAEDILQEVVQYPTDEDDVIDRFFAISVVNLCRTVPSLNLYLGYNNTYRSYGNFKTLDGYPIDVRDGDTYIGMFEFNSAHMAEDSTYFPAGASITYYVPIESSIDFKGVSGSLKSKSDSDNPQLIQDFPVSLSKHSQDSPAYVYDSAYSMNPTATQYYEQENVKDQQGIFDTRVIYSKQKASNEKVDSYTQFQSANFIDVNSRYGQITNLRAFKNMLVFWQESATGMLSVNERTMLQDANDANIILGNGDVLLRYDYITTEYGMKPNQFVDTQSNSTLYWWDGYKKEILGYSSGQAAIPMNKAKTINSYIEERDEVNKPHVQYDNKYNEVLMSVVGEASLVYSELTQQFMAVYTKSFDHSFRFKNNVLLTKGSDIHLWDGSNTYLQAKLRYIVNDKLAFVKVYDIMLFGLGKDYFTHPSDKLLNNLKFSFVTKGQSSSFDTNTNKEDGKITNVEYDYLFTIPRSENVPWANRMRGKTMECELSVKNDTKDFSIQYITTKYRIFYN